MIFRRKNTVKRVQMRVPITFRDKILDAAHSIGMSGTDYLDENNVRVAAKLTPGENPAKKNVRGEHSTASAPNSTPVREAT